VSPQPIRSCGKSEVFQTFPKTNQPPANPARFITFFFVTHDQEEALTLSDRIAVMAGGQVLQADTPARLYEVPNSREVANFIGTMNFFDAEVTTIDKNAITLRADGLGALQVPLADVGYAPGARVTAVIRPEKITLSETEPAKGAQKVCGVLENAAYLGERSHFYVRVEGQDQPVAVSAQNQNKADGIDHAAHPVWLSWKDDAIVVLDSD
jgi:spermidine/putrescine transport system ATP-binding protein